MIEKMKNVFNSLIIKLTWQRKQSLSLRISEQKSPKLKKKKYKDEEKNYIIFSNCGTTTKGVTYL